MTSPALAELRAAIRDEALRPADYNFPHFRAAHILADAWRTIVGRGIRAGETAPDFTLPRADGGTLRLSELRGTPILLHLGSYT